MKHTGLILAAHGSTAEPQVNRDVAALAGKIAERDLVAEVRCAFHKGTPQFGEAVDAMSADEIVVVPLMASDGYYATRVLPAALATAQRFGEVPIRQTHAVGAHPQIQTIAASRCRAVMTRFGCDPLATTVLLVGHGTPRHRDSCQTTQRCAEAFVRVGVASDVCAAFIEDQPSLEDALEGAAHADVVVIPFMIGFGRHVTQDVARRIGLGAVTEAELPIALPVREGRVILDVPVGVDPGIESLIIDLATASAGARVS